jgi:cholinesterase
MSFNSFVIVDTEYGPVKGITKGSCLGAQYVNFQGIPYMRPPVGKLRFKVEFVFKIENELCAMRI